MISTTTFMEIERCQMIHHIERKTTRWIYMVLGETDKKTNDFQTRHCGQRFGKICPMRLTQRKTKVGYRETKARQRQKIAWYYAARNKFERFRGKREFGINQQIRFRFSSSRELFFWRFEFLVYSKFNNIQRDCTCACAVASLSHAIPFRMLWRTWRFMMFFYYKSL